MSEIWFTGCDHFHHENILYYCNRPFKNVKEMNEILIENWNELVKPSDIVYNLGDFCFTWKNYQDPVRHLVEKLNGTIHMIFGNHDRRPVRRFPFPWSGDYKEIKVAGKKIILFHYSIDNWNAKPYGSIHLHSHSHGKSETLPNRVDVGVDCWNFKPVPLDKILEICDGSQVRE